MDVADVVPSDVPPELADGLDEGDDLDVADGAADLDDDHIDVLGAEGPDAFLDLVGHVRDDLDGLAQVVTPALLGDHRRVDPAGGGVGVLVEVLVDEPLVVAEVEVGLAAVLGDEDLAVLERVHRARVDVDVRVELAHGDPEARHLSRRPSDEAVRPLPRDDDTPPVKKMYLVAVSDRAAGAVPSRAPACARGGPAVVCSPKGCGGPSMSGT